MMTESTPTRTISFPGDLLYKAQEAARLDGRSLSNYIQTLIRADLDQKVRDYTPARKAAQSTTSKTLSGQ
jgi:hypothetical protein